MKFERGGKTVSPLSVIAKCDKERTGTTVTLNCIQKYLKKQLTLTMNY